MSKGIGDSVIRPLKNALDDMPIHVRQLAEMFRKHGQKQNRNTSAVQNLDSADVTHPLQTAWRSDTDWTPDGIVGTTKKDRPDPGDYLDGDYVRQHLDRFEGGATRFYRADNLEKYGPGNGGTTFVFPTSEIDDIIRQADGDPEALSPMLGLGDGFFGTRDNPVDVIRADFSPQQIADGNLRLPSGNEGGANPQWIPGGYLPDGIPEAVFDISDRSVGDFTPFYVE